MRSGAGHSGLARTRDAAGEAVERARASAGGLERARFALAFVTPHHADAVAEIAPAVREACGAELVVGCVGGGVIAGTAEHGGARPGLSLLLVDADERTLAATPIAASGGRPPEAIAREIAETVEAAATGPLRRSLLTLLPCPFHVDIGSVLVELHERLRFVPTVGAAAAAAAGKERTVGFVGERVVEGGVVGLFLSGQIRPVVACAQGCRMLTATGQITSLSGNTIHTIDARPALEKLQRALERAESLRELRGIFCALGISTLTQPQDAGDFLIRHIVRVDRNDGSIVVAGEPEVGQHIAFAALDAQSAREDMEARIAEVAPGIGTGEKDRPRFGMLFECLGRGQGLYGEAGHDAGVVRRHLGDIAVAGLFGNAEIAPLLGRNHVHAYTAVLAVVQRAD